ncbi:tetratricopeptide repeat protein [Streptomyces sp. NPDC001852]|uniref:tetratricopeptide repeat protein n=1 Tax=Streptomyces sp. NPDC001852 TaxID=3364619 RepID=UPI0036815280
MGQSGRLGLVVSARWLAYKDDQAYMHEAAEVIAAALYDPVLGACEPAVAGLRVLRDPPKKVLEERIQQAFENASSTGSTLVLYLIGHGSSDFDDDLYHFIPADHPVSLDALPARGYPLGARLRTLHGEFPGSDGVILIIDTCESGRLAGERRWSMPMKRISVSTATSYESGWQARFSRVVGEHLEAGIDDAGRYLRASDFQRHIPRWQDQFPHHFIHDESDDAGLWISANRASRKGLVEDLVARVTRRQGGLHEIHRRYQRPEGHDPVAQSVREHRRVAVLGPSGSGKSATLQMTAIDRIDPGRAGPNRDPSLPGQAVAFFPIAADTTPEEFARQINDQLYMSARDAFVEAEEAFLRTMQQEEVEALPATERWLTGPLRHLPGDVEVLLVIDALDQLPAEAETAVTECISELGDTHRYGHVSTVVSVRHRPEYGYPAIVPVGFECVAVPPSTVQQVRRYVERRNVPVEHVPGIVRIAEGNWLIVTLLCNELSGRSERDTDRDTGLPTTREDLYDRLLTRALGEYGREQRENTDRNLAAILAVLAYGGESVLVPLAVLRAASESLEGPSTVAGVRTALVALHHLVERVEPGTDREQLTAIHPTFIDHLQRSQTLTLPSAVRTHSAIADALAKLAPMADGRNSGDDPVRAYAERSEATHRWEAGDPDGALDVLIGRPAALAGENRLRWERWTRTITHTLGPADLRSLRARRELASWTSRCGLFASATELYSRLLPDVTHILGTDDTLSLRVELDAALTRGVSGHASEARDLLQDLVPRIRTAQGPHSELTLEARHALGSWTGLAGSPRAAMDQIREVLQECRQYLGEEHSETLACRNSLARWTGESGYAAQAVEEFSALLPLQTRQLGPLHRETLRTRYSIAYWNGEAGRPGQTLALLRDLVPQQIEALGEDHPDTLRTQHGIGLWSGVNGDPAEAIRILTDLMPARIRVLGPDHPDTLRTLNNLGRWTGVMGRYDEAVRILEETRERRTRSLGASHPDTMRTVNNIIDFTGAAGDFARARQLADELLPLQESVLGPHHQDTLRTRFNQAKWQAAQGDAAGALDNLRHLLRDQQDAIGPEHPNTLRTAEEIAALEQQAGA